MSISLIAFSRLVILAGLALWLTIAVINNLTDPGTNRTLLGHTLSMGLVSAEEVLGAGLLWRAWPAHWSHTLLYIIVAVQFMVAGFLWRSVISYAKAFLQQDGQRLLDARGHATLALSLFILLWMFFICGGLWFGYWLKQGPVQMVHMTLILIGIGALIFVQAQPQPEPSPTASTYTADPLSSTSERSPASPGETS
ncbi:hypothetical protein BRI6_1350 [plant metagenome]|uniref:DUF2165 domain-containing protein n=1 Tax=plant metagenome TaxID=1297885 RepID=A0A484S3V9_9ZZZZ